MQCARVGVRDERGCKLEMRERERDKERMKLNRFTAMKVCKAAVAVVGAVKQRHINVDVATSTSASTAYADGDVKLMQQNRRNN